jgi:hypothetical protein
MTSAARDLACAIEAAMDDLIEAHTSLKHSKAMRRGDPGVSHGANMILEAAATIGEALHAYQSKPQQTKQ